MITIQVNENSKLCFKVKIYFDLEIRHIGPCSVAALKSGTLSLKWDTIDIYRILNGDKTNRLVYPNGDRKLISKNLF